MTDKVTIPALLQMKRDGRKSVGVVAWDYQIARIADRAGVDIVSVGDSVGVNLWGHSNPLEVTMDEMLVCCKAVRRGTTRALVSCDFPFGPLQEGIIPSTLRARRKPELPGRKRSCRRPPSSTERPAMPSRSGLGRVPLPKCLMRDRSGSRRTSDAQ